MIFLFSDISFDLSETLVKGKIINRVKYRYSGAIYKFWIVNTKNVAIIPTEIVLKSLSFFWLIFLDDLRMVFKKEPRLIVKRKISIP